MALFRQPAGAPSDPPRRPTGGSGPLGVGPGTLQRRLGDAPGSPRGVVLVGVRGGPEPVFGQVASEVPFWTVLGAIQESFLDEYKVPFAVHFWTSLVPLWNVLETIQESFLDELEAPFAVDS